VSCLPLLECEDLSVKLGDRDVLDHINLVVGEGDLVGLVGPNGSGKTTLIRAIAGFVPYTGSVRLAGRDEKQMGRRQVASFLSVVPQEPPSSQLLVYDYIMLGRYAHLDRWGDEGPEDKAAVKSAMELFGVGHLSGRRLDSLSGGELQGVLLARAVAQASHLMLLDEPTSHLDLKAQQEVMRQIGKLEGKRAVLASFHDLTLAGRFSKKVIVLKQGRQFASGEPQDVLTPEVIEAVYGVRVLVKNDPVFHVVLLPRRTL